jgi:uncharacterized protein YciI
MAERIVDHFGPATLEVIEEAPGRLVEVPGLGPKRTAMITAAWAEQQAIKEVMWAGAPYVQAGLYASVEIHDWQFGGRPPSSLKRPA